MTLEELEIVVKANVEEATGKLEELKTQMQDSTTEGFKEITKEADKMGEAVADNSKNIEKMIPQIASLTTKAVTGSTAMAGFSKTVVASSTALKTAFPILLAISVVIMAIVKAVNSLREKIANMVKTIKQTIKTALDTILKLLQKINSMAIRLGTVLSNLARNGISNLVQVSSELNNVLSQIQGKTIQLGNALASAVAPIIQALTPIIISMLNALISVANVLGEITASLFGNATVYKKATNVTTDYSKAIGKANKEQQKMLAGFDELNVLSDKQGSGNGIGTAVQDMFETTEIRKEIKDFTAEIKRVFKEIRKEIEKGNFTGAGDILGREFNRLVENINTEDLGRQLAIKMNQALEFVNGFLQNKPLGTIGKKLGQFVRGWIEEISPTEIGRLIANTINNAFSFVGNFLGEINKDNGALKLGQKIARNLITAIENIDVDEVANAIYQTVKTLADLAIGFFGTWIKEGGLTKLVNKIAELFRAIPWKEILPEVIQAIGTAWVAIEGTRFVLRNAILIGILSWITGELKERIVGGVKSVWDSIFNTADESGQTLKDRLQSAWLKVKNWWDEKKKQIAGENSLAKTFFKNAIKNIVKFFIDGVNKLIRKINSIKFTLPDILGGGSWSPSLKELQMPELAQGGVLTKPTAVLAGEYVGASQNPEIVTPQKLLLETSTQANVPVMNSIEEMGDKIISALNSIGVYAEFDYSKLKVGLDNENYRVGGKLYGI